MYVEIELELLGYSASAGPARRMFWERFIRARRGGVSDGGDFSVPTDDEIRDFEQRFRIAFPEYLETRLNEEFRRASSKWKLEGKRLEVKLATIEYGSLKPILELTGIENADFRDFVLTLLLVYSPAAFRDAMGTPNLDGLDVSVDIVGKDTDEVGDKPSNRQSGREALGRAWIIANTSLIFPIGLALLVCYYAFSALNHELDASRSQAALMQSERNETVKSLQAQNSKLAELLISHASNAEKALSEILVAVTKSASDRVVGPARSTTP